MSDNLGNFHSPAYINPAFDETNIENKSIDNFKDINNEENTVNIVGKSNEHEPRETWTGTCDFFLSALGYAVGLGAVWRFPYLCYRNGGGVFLIPYFFFLFLIGIPLVFLELCVGQFTSSGPLTCWTMTPVFRGVGIAMNVVNSYLTIYYNMIIAYSLYFLVLSLRSLLPWQFCSLPWKSRSCVDNYASSNFTSYRCENTTEALKCNDGQCYNLTTINGLTATCDSDPSILSSLGWWSPVFPSQDYWTNFVLRKSTGIDDTGEVVWQLAIALFIGWIIVFAMVVKGIHVSGKLVYFTSLFPYVVLLILGIRGWMLPGADIGIKFYIYPEFSRLKDIGVWSDAANQIFFTLSISYGGLVALSSYNKFDTNVMRDAIFVSISNCLTSVFAGFVVFSYIGYLSKVTGKDLNEVVQAGQGLAFVVYPYAVTTIKVSPLWAVLFFFMMLVLGLDTMMASVEIIITSLFDLLPILKLTRLRRTVFISLICAILFLLGLTFCTQSGTYWVEVVDYYSGGWAVLLVGAIECISIMWFYGFENFRTDISVMIGRKITHNKLFYIWKILWTFVSPGILIVLVVLSFKDSERLKSGNYIYPVWTEIIGNLMTISTVIGILIWAICMIIYKIVKKEPLKTLIIPDSSWRPLIDENYKLVLAARENTNYSGCCNRINFKSNVLTRF